MANQEQIIDQTEGQVANGTNVTDAPAEVVADAQVTEASDEAAAVDPATKAQEQPLNAFNVPSATGTCCRFGGFNSAEICDHEFHEPRHQFMTQAPDRTSPEEREDLATERLNSDLRELAALIQQKEVQAPNAEATPVKKPGKGRRNQKKHQAPPQVGQWLNAKFERKTERGIIVRAGKARFHVDFRDMALAEDGTAIRFQEGDKVRVRVLNLNRHGGLPQATMLGKMLPPVKVNRPAIEAATEVVDSEPAIAIQAEVVSHLAGRAALDQLRAELPSAKAMELHEGFAAGMAEAVAQAVEPETEAAAEAVDSVPATEAAAEVVDSVPAIEAPAEVVDSVPAIEAATEVVDSVPAIEAPAEADPVD